MGTTAVYARISDDRRDGVGVENQLEECRRWCAAQGWEPVTEYVDNDVSASVYARKPRRDYQLLLAAVEAGEVERIVCFNTDRLYRQPRELEALIPLAERMPIVSKVGGLLDLSTAGGRLNARIQVSIAANESEIKSERIKLAQQRNRAQGKPHGGARPFGWLALDGDGRSWDPRRHDPQESELIRQAARDVLAGATITDIAKAWNASGVRQVRGSQGWHPTTIRSLLTAPRNAGLVGSHGDVVGQGEWTAILDPPVWERVCAELKRRGDRYSFERAPRHLLTGVLVCGVCGVGLMHGRTRATATYRCKKGPGAAGCGRVQIAAEPLECDITETLFQRADNTKFAEMAQATAGSPVQDVAAELAQLETDAASTARLAAQGRIRPEDFATFSEATEERQRKLRARLAELSGAVRLEPYAGRPGALRAAWPSLTTSQRRGLILDGLGRLVVDPATGPGYDYGRVRGVL